MNIKIVTLSSIVLSLGIIGMAYSSAVMPQPQINSAILDINPLIVNPTSTALRNNVVNQSVNNINNASVKPQTYQATQHVNLPNKELAAKKDLQVEGRIEKVQKNPLYTNQTPQEMQELVSTVGYKIIMRNGLSNSIKFVYSEKDTVNANTNINNTVTVYKGLLKYCEDEDELAYVIGHEIGHAMSNHVIKTVATKSASNIASAAAIYGISQVTNNKWAIMGIETATKLGTDMAENKISRVQEINADLLGVDYAVKAGYNPLASISLIHKIGENYPDFWQDHPSTDKRIIKMYTYIKTKYPKYIDEGYDSFAYNQAIQSYINYAKISNYQ